MFTPAGQLSSALNVGAREILERTGAGGSDAGRLIRLLIGTPGVGQRDPLLRR